MESHRSEDVFVLLFQSSCFLLLLLFSRFYFLVNVFSDLANYDLLWKLLLPLIASFPIDFDDFELIHRMSIIIRCRNGK